MQGPVCNIVKLKLTRKTRPLNPPQGDFES